MPTHWSYVFLALTHRYVKAWDSHSKVSYSWKWCKKNSHIFSGLNLSVSKTLQYPCCVAWFTGFLAQVWVTSEVGGSVDGSCEDTWRRQLITGRSYYNIVALLVWSRERLSSQRLVWLCPPTMGSLRHLYDLIQLSLLWSVDVGKMFLVMES